MFKKTREGGGMKFLWSIALGLALSCFSGGAFGTTEMELFDAIIANDETKAKELIDKPKSSWNILKTGKFATDLDQTTDQDIAPAVDVTRVTGTKFSVTRLENVTPLILAAWFNCSAIIEKLISAHNDGRNIGHKAEAKAHGSDSSTADKYLDLSAIDVARSRGYKKLVKKLIDEKIGSDDDIKTAQDWLDGIALKEKLKTLQESLTKLKAKLNQLTQSLQQLKAGLTT